MQALDWSDLQHFLAVHRAGTLTAAARQLKVDATTVGRRLASLERALGARLVERADGRFALTALGKRVLANVEGIDELSLSLQRATAAESLSGTVRLAATEAMAVNHVLPHLHRFGAAHPELELEVVTGNPSVSLSRREADLALRLLRPSQAGLFAKKVAVVAIAPYVSKRYLHRHPEAPEGWAGHRVIAYTAEARGWPEARWLEEKAGKAAVALRVNSVLAAAEAVKTGAGIGLLPCGIGDRTEGLTRLGGPAKALEREVWLVVHQDVRNSPRVRATWDFLVDVMAKEAAVMRGRE